MKRTSIELVEATSSTGAERGGGTHVDLAQVNASLGAVIPVNPQDASGGASPYPIDGGRGEVARAMGRVRGQILDVVGVMVPPQLGVGGRSSAQPTLGKEASDTAGMRFPGTGGAGDRNVIHLTEKSTPPETSVAVRCAQDETDLCPGDVDPTLIEPTPGAEGQVPCVRDPGFVQSVSLAAFARVQEEREQLARRLDDLLSVLPVALTMKNGSSDWRHMRRSCKVKAHAWSENRKSCTSGRESGRLQ